MMEVRKVAAPLRTQVVALLRDAIIAAEFAPGERLVERNLVERYEVSRTVIREALRQLEQEGLVEMIANQGPVVATLSVQDVISLYEVREVLEALAGRSFAQNATATQRTALERRLKAVEAAIDNGDLKKLLKAKDSFYSALLDGAGNAVARASLITITRVPAHARPDAASPRA